MTWYSGDGGITRLAGAVGGAVRDVRRVRRGWHWDTPRPSNWPERGAVVPTPASDLGWARQELRPVMRRMLAICEAEDILKPQAVYGYWQAAGQGNDLILFDTDGRTELARFALPRVCERVRFAASSSPAGRARCARRAAPAVSSGCGSPSSPAPKQSSELKKFP